jgi:hypothetical protein
MCSVAILFISDNMVNLLGGYFSATDHTKTVVMASIALVFILATNMFTEMRVVSVFALFSSVFFILGAVVIGQYALQQPSHWDSLPAAGTFRGIIMMVRFCLGLIN